MSSQNWWNTLPLYLTRENPWRTNNFLSMTAEKDPRIQKHNAWTLRRPTIRVPRGVSQLTGKSVRNYILNSNGYKVGLCHPAGRANSGRRRILLWATEPVPYPEQNHVYFSSMQTTVNQNQVQFHCIQLESQHHMWNCIWWLNQVLKTSPRFQFWANNIPRFNFFSYVQLQLGSWGAIPPLTLYLF